MPAKVVLKTIILEVGLAALLVASTAGLVGCFTVGDIPLTEGGVPEDGPIEAGPDVPELPDTTPYEPASRRAESGELAYPEVMRVGVTCTGTVVGPYAVLTSTRCAEEVATISWTDAVHEWTHAYPNPLLRSEHSLPWWAAAYAKKVADGNPAPDSPTMSDQMLLFVPSLTPELLAENDIEPASVRSTNRRPVPTRDDTYRASTVGGDAPAARRRWLDVAMVEAVQDQIALHPRDGFMTLSGLVLLSRVFGPEANGGPVLASHVYVWPGGNIEGPRSVLGTIASSRGDTAPLAHPHILNTSPNQETTLRANRIWVNARTDDIDGDSIPSACDSDPGSATGSTSSCPAPIGSPQLLTESVSIGLLDCEGGFVPYGVEARQGNGIRRLQMRCRARSCLAPGLACGSEDQHLADDYFGDSVGASQIATCPARSVISRITAKTDANGVLQQLSLHCTPFEDLRSGSTATTLGGTVGASSVTNGQDHDRPCAPGEYVTGLVARSGGRAVEGLQPICEPANAITRYAGGINGAPTRFLCPGGYIARGIEIFDDRTSPSEYELVAHLGLRCGRRSMIDAPSSDADEWVVHGYFYDEDESHSSKTDYSWPSMRRPADRALPVVANALHPLTIHRCADGSALSSLGVRAGNMIDAVTSIGCRTLAGASSEVTVDVGGDGGAPVSLACPASRPFVNGVNMRSLHMVDGLSLECTP